MARVLRHWRDHTVTMSSKHDQRVCVKCGCDGVSVAGVSHSLLVYLRCDTCGYLATTEHSYREAVSDLANALQAAVLISVELEAKAFDHFDVVGSLQDALREAVTALRKLQRPPHR